MTVSVANLPYSFSPTSAGASIQGIMLKNGYDAWFYNSTTGTVTQITDVNFPGYHTYSVTLTSSGTTATATCASVAISSISSVLGLATATTAAAHGLTTNDIVRIANANGTDITVSSITQTGGTATVTTATNHGYTTNDVVFITGASPTDYNGSWVITVTGLNTFTYSLNNIYAATPATFLTPAIPATDVTPAVPAVPILSTKGIKQVVTSITQTGGLATATLTNHGYTTGNVIAIAGVTSPSYNIYGIQSSASDGLYGVSVGTPRVAFSTTAPTNLGIGDTITISGTGEPTYDGDHVITGTNGASGFFFASSKIAGNINAGTVKRKTSAFNGSKVITVTGANTFTFPIVSYAESTAAGTIDAVPDMSAYTGLQTITVTGANSFTFVVSNLPNTSTTATYLQPHGLAKNDTVTIAGATPAAYNGTYTVSGVQSDFFTYTFAGGTSPATGTITATGGRTTVPGIAYLDSTFYVMDTAGRIYGSDLSRPPQWGGLNFLTAQIEPGAGKAIAKSQNYVIAYKEWSTEAFYDAANPTGSPLSPVQTGFQLVGCASGDSVVNLDGVIYWLSQTKQKGRSVHMQSGLVMNQISTPDVERILNLSTLATVYAWGIKVAGHTLYVLTLVDLNLTLVHDLTSKAWGLWTSLTPAASKSVTSITLNGQIATVSCTGHGLNDGDMTTISGASVGGLNTSWVVNVVDANTFTFETALTGTVTGTITSSGYIETYFKYTHYVNAFGSDLVQHETNGTICAMTELSFQDAGNPINTVIRTGKIDFGNGNLKRYASAEVIGNKVNGTMYLRHTGDDYQTWTAFRPVNLANIRSIVRRLGADRRRAYELRYQGNTSLQVSDLDLEVV